MSINDRKIKVLLAKLGLDVHSRGAIVVANMLRESGMELIYIGNAFPAEITEVAIQEGVDTVGISTLGGSHLTLGGELMELAKQKGICDSMVFIIGGVFPPYDVPKLKEIGFDGVFNPGATQEQISTFIREAVATKTALSSNR